jgi:ribosomal protein S27AE
MIAVLTLSLLSLYVSNWFLLPFFALIFSAQFLLKRIVCPNCGTPVTYQGTFAGFRVQGGFIRKKCQQCGWDLDKNLSPGASTNSNS